MFCSKKRFLDFKMIDREKLEMCEVEYEEYISLKTKLEMQTGDPGSDTDYGFARITKPLVFEDYMDLLRHFKETPNARRVSVKKNNWQRIYANDLDEESIARLVYIAHQTGFIYVSFFDRFDDEFTDKKSLNNEIGFEPELDKIASAALSIPGEIREKYGWKGSDEYYYSNIWGLYVPTIENRRYRLLRRMVKSVRAGEQEKVNILNELYVSLGISDEDVKYEDCRFACLMAATMGTKKFVAEAKDKLNRISKPSV